MPPFLALPEEVQVAGQETAFLLYFINEEQRDSKISPPETLELWLVTEDGRTIVITAWEPVKDRHQIVVRGGFLKKEYRFQLPDGLEGQVQVSVAGYSRAQGHLTVQSAPLPTPYVPTPESFAPPEIYPTLGSLFTLYQPYEANLSVYEPIYFLVGTDPGKSKFQLSMKYRLFNPEGTLARNHPWVQGIHLAFTQTSYWDLESDSAPFEDTSYKPEIFFLSTNFKQRPSWLQGAFLQVGLNHESNGRSGEASRSTNTAYLKSYLIYYDPQTKLGLQLSPKFLVYLHNDPENNPDLPDYRGYVELETKLGKANGYVLAVNLRFAEKGTSFHTDLSYPISKLLKSNFDIFFQIQYSNSLAESLLEYQRRTEAIRMGLSIVR